MLFCRDCGNSSVLENGDDGFYGSRRYSCWARIYYNSNGDVTDEDGEFDDYEAEETGDDIICSHCTNDNVERDWNGDENDAQAVRDSYNLIQTQASIRREQRREEQVRTQGIYERLGTFQDKKWDGQDNAKTNNEPF